MPDILMIGIPTNDEMMVGRMILNMCTVAAEMKRVPYFDFGLGTNICIGRGSILKVAKEVMRSDSGRVLWLDSDIMMQTPPTEIAKYLKEAEEKNYNIVAPYRRIDQYSSICKSIDDKEPIKWNDLQKLEQYEKVGWAGLGFYYGHTPFDYKFHMSSDANEDYYFFKENNIELRVEKRITLYHNKRVFI